MGTPLSPRRRLAASSLGSLAVLALGIAVPAGAAARPLPFPQTVRAPYGMTLQRIDDSATATSPAALRYAGSWQVSTGSATTQGTQHSAQSSASATISWTGTQLLLHGPKGPSFGRASISVDGGPATVVDSYGTTLRQQALLFASKPLAQGAHTAVVTVLGQRGPASTGSTWSLDSLVVVAKKSATPTPTPPPTPSPTPTPTPTPSPTPTPTPAPVPVTKTNYGGLYGTTSTDRLRRGVSQQWLKVRWSDLEPSEGVYNWAPITTLLASDPRLVVRVHVGGGQFAPQWLKAAAGSVQVTNAKDGITATVGQYWTPRYMSAYSRFVTALGAQLDSHPRIASVNMFGTSLIYDEPWITGGTASGAALYTAGLTKDKVIAAQNAGLSATVKAFPHTVVEMPLHGQFTYPVAGGQKGTWADGIGLANAWDAQYGNRVVFTDYGWGAGDYTAAATSLATAPNLYSWMHKRADLGRPIALQATLVPGTAAGTTKPTAEVARAAADEAVRMGARWFEHASWGYLTVDEAAAFDAGLKANVK